jgi:hypothetical protein
MRPIVIAALVGLVTPCPPLASAWGQEADIVIEGIVFDDAQRLPLSGARVDGQAGAKPVVHLITSTGSDGTFVIHVRKYFQESDVNQGLNLFINAPGRSQAVVYIPSYDELTAKRHWREIWLRQKQPPTTTSKPNSSSADGRTVFVRPYDVSTFSNTDGWNAALLSSMRFKINTYLQTLKIRPTIASVAVEAVPAPMVHDDQQMRKVGVDLNALAVIRGELGARDAKGMMSMTSEFIYIPSIPHFPPGSFSTEDRIAQQQLIKFINGNLKIYEQSERGVGFSIALKEAESALTSDDHVTGLQRARACLVAERAKIVPKPSNEPFVRQINSLLEVIVSGAKPRASRLNGLSAATDEVWEVRNDR